MSDESHTVQITRAEALAILRVSPSPTEATVVHLLKAPSATYTVAEWPAPHEPRGGVYDLMDYYQTVVLVELPTIGGSPLTFEMRNSIWDFLVHRERAAADYKLAGPAES